MLKSLKSQMLLALLLAVAEAAQAQTDPLAVVTVTAVTPLAGVDISASKLPYYTQSAGDESLARSQTLDVTQFMNRRLAGVTLNEAQGNPLQPDVQFRGFTATPLLGGSEGVSVYVDGVRVNEVFGDTVNWDLIPEAAIARMTMLSGANPIFGMNTLGGAISIQTKNGFGNPGTRAEYSSGSFGRTDATLETGGNTGPWGWYVMGNNFDEHGWRDLSPSRAAALNGTFSWRGSNTSLDLHASRANTRLVGNGAAPVEELAERYRGIFTAPDQTSNSMTLVSLQGRTALDATSHLSFNLYRRLVNTASYNGDTTDAEECDDNEDILCDETGNPQSDQNGNPVSSANDAINNISHRRQRADGGTLQLSLGAPFEGLENQLVLGADAVRGHLGFDSAVEASMLQDNLQTVANTGIFIPGAELSIRSDTSTSSAYFTDTLSLTKQLALTLSGRWNRTRTSIQDLTGNNGGLDGQHAFSRFNPAAGLTYQLTPRVNLYGGYSESTRAPTPVELTCADDDAPCKLPNQFLSDPPLQQVVAKSWELGMRGTLDRHHDEENSWHLGLFRTINRHDILFQVTGGASSNEGFYANVGDTLRQGLEATFEGTGLNRHLHWYASDTYLQATYRTGFSEISANHPDADDDGVIDVPGGARIPGLPRNSFKIGADFSVSRSFSIGGDITSQTGQYLRSDEANLLSQIPGFAVVNLHAQCALSSRVSVFGRIDNVLDHHYYTFGVLGEPGEVFPGFNDARFLSPAQPLGVWVGIAAQL